MTDQPISYGHTLKELMKQVEQGLTILPIDKDIEHWCVLLAEDLAAEFPQYEFDAIGKAQFPQIFVEEKVEGEASE